VFDALYFIHWIDLVLRYLRFSILLRSFLVALILIFSLLAERLAGWSMSDMTYLVPSGTLNFNSVSVHFHSFIVPLAVLFVDLVHCILLFALRLSRPSCNQVVSDCFWNIKLTYLLTNQLVPQPTRQPAKLKPSYDPQQTWPPLILRLLTSTKWHHSTGLLVAMFIGEDLLANRRLQTLLLLWLDIRSLENI